MAFSTKDLAAAAAANAKVDALRAEVLATGVLNRTPAPSPTPAAANAFTTALSSSSGTVGNAVTLAVTPTGAAWPSSVVLTPAAAGLSGTFAPTTRTPSGTTAATFTFTPSTAGSGTISVSASPSMTAPAGLAYQATAAATQTPTPSGNVTAYSFAGAAGMQPAVPSFVFGAANGSGVDGSGHYNLVVGSGWAAFAPAAMQQELVITLAQPGQISFGFGFTGSGSTANSLYLYNDYGYMQAVALTDGAYAGYVFDTKKPYPTGTVWRMVQSGAQFALYVDGAVFCAASSPSIAGGGQIAVRLVDGATSPVLLASAASNTVATLPSVSGLAVQFLPVSTALLAGVKVFQASSTTTTGNHSFALSGAGAALLNVDVNTGAGTLKADHPPLGALAFTLTDSDSGASASGDFTANVVQGNTLVASAMPITVAAGLTNGTAIGSQVATFAPPSGMSGLISYSLQSRPGSIDGPATRYAVGASALTLTALLGASPDPLTLVATNGTDVCASPFVVSAAAVVGPVFECGPGQPYVAYANATSAVFEDAVGAHIYGPGAKFRVHTRPDRRDWYGELTGSAIYDRGKQMAYGGYAGPYSIEGVPDPVTGALPVVGGAPGYYGKGSILFTMDRDVSVSNLEAEAVLIGGNNVSGIKDDGGRQGDTVITNFYGHNCCNAYLGDTKGTMTLSNILTLMCGDGDAGHTHNWYQDAIQATVKNMLTSAVNGGHGWKDRSVRADYTDCRFFEGLIGRNSAAIDMPNGGSRSFTRCTFQKGPMANNSAMIQYGRESLPGVPNQPSYIHNNPGDTVTFTDCVFINHYPGFFGNGPATAILSADSYGRTVIDPVTGNPINFVFVRCSQFGFTPGRFLVTSGTDSSATTFPPGVATLSEPPPLDYTSPLLGGAPVRQPSPWWNPNPSTYTVFNTDCANGIIDPGAHELRVAPSAALGTTVGVPLVAWGRQSVASSDPAFNPWGTGAVWSLNTSGPGSSPYFAVSASGSIRVAQALTAAPVLNFLDVVVTSADGTRKTEAILLVLISTTPARIDGIPAGLGPRSLPLGQEALG